MPRDRDRDLSNEPKQNNLASLLFGVAEQAVKSIEHSTGLGGLWDAGKHIANEAIGEFATEHPRVLGNGSLIARLLHANMTKVFNAADVKDPSIKKVEGQG